MFLKRLARQKRFSWYLIALIYLVVNLGAFLFFSREKENHLVNISQFSKAKQAELFSELNRVIEFEISMLETFLNIISENKGLAQAMKNSDRDALYNVALPIYQSLFQKNNISHFNFIDQQGLIFLRMHKPYDYADLALNFSSIKAIKNRQTYKGLELGNYQILGLRVVIEWQYEKNKLGYIDLGIPLSHVISQLYNLWENTHASPIDMILLVDKNQLKQEKWLEGNQLFKREKDWNQLQNSIVSMTTNQLSDTQLDVFSSMQILNNSFHAGKVDGVYQHYIMNSLEDISGNNIGKIGIIFDVDNEVKEIKKKFYWNFGLFFLLSSVIILLLEILSVFQQRQAKRINAFLEKQVVRRTHQLFLKKESLKNLLKEQERNTGFKILLNKALEIMLTAECKESLFDQVLELIEHDCHNDCVVGVFDNKGKAIKQGSVDAQIGPIIYNEKLAEHLHIPIYIEDKHIATIVLKSQKVKWLDASDYDFFNALAKIISLGLDRLDFAERLKQTNVVLEEQVKRRTEALEKSMLEAEKANQTKSVFLANMSHEIRTPMHAVISFSSYGMSRVDKVPLKKLYTYFKRIHSSGERLLNLLDDILDISKYEASKMPLNYTEERLSQVAKRSVKEQESLLQKKNIKICWEFETDNDRAEFDRERMIQVVANLLSNAIKFSPQEGNIYFTFSNAMLDSDHGNLPGVKLTIRDEGVGIANDELESIFDKFVQSKKIRAGVGGTGLGLAICKEIVNLHHGKIWAEPNYNLGAGFVVLIPQKKPKVDNNE